MTAAYFEPTAETDSSGRELARGYVRIVRELADSTECDVADVGPMFEVSYITPARLFGQSRHAFAEELT